MEEMSSNEVQAGVQKFFDIMKLFGENYDSLWDTYLVGMLFIGYKDGQYYVGDNELPKERDITILQDALNDYVEDPWNHIDKHLKPYLHSDLFNLKRPEVSINNY